MPANILVNEEKFGEKVRRAHKSSESEFGDTADKPKNIGRTAQKIIDLSFPTFLCQPKLWLIKLGISSRAVEKQIAKLRSMGILSREGADFGGYWRIILSYHFEGMRRSTLRLYNWRQNWAKKVS
mgnify:CR=1 FL=1